MSKINIAVTVITIMVFSLAGLPALSSPSVYAETKSKDAQRGKEEDIQNYVSGVDADKGGHIDAVEVSQAAQKDFKKLDINGDGVINEKDGKIFLTKEEIALIDVDKDGNITIWEYTIYFLKNYHQADSNKDGKIVPQEMVDYSKKRDKEWRAPK